MHTTFMVLKEFSYFEGASDITEERSVSYAGHHGEEERCYIEGFDCFVFTFCKLFVVPLG